MADLDDFFAKKDRKKSKGKKFTTTDEIAKKLEETGRKLEKAKKDKTTMQSQALTETDEQGNTIQEEDEWREFEEQKKDYSGLRIGKLQIQEGVDEGDGDGEEEELEENEAGEMVVRTRKVQSGPWKMQQIEQQQQQQQEQQAQMQAAQQAAAEELAAERRAEPERGAYRAPALRNAQRETTPSMGGLRSRVKTAPDIRNEESFPTLSASKNMDGNAGPWARRRRDEANFEEVRNSRSHSSRYSDAGRLATSTGPKLSLGNKFGALSHDQS